MNQTCVFFIGAALGIAVTPVTVFVTAYVVDSYESWRHRREVYKLWKELNN